MAMMLFKLTLSTLVMNTRTYAVFHKALTCFKTDWCFLYLSVPNSLAYICADDCFSI